MKNLRNLVAISNRRDIATLVRPIIVIDGMFFQYFNTGIARVWTNLFREWTRSGFSNHVVVLDRAGSAPRFKGLHYFPLPAHDYVHTEDDSILLENTCKRLGADLFVSTYYTTPLTTPSIFMGHDMIPEVLGLDPEQPMWREKRRAICHASAHIMVSQNSARDLERFMPCVAPGSTIVAPPGTDPALERADQQACAAFRVRHDLQRPYILLVGERVGAGGYKNAVLVFQALAHLPDQTHYTLLCAGGQKELEAELAGLARQADVRRLTLSDEELACAYSGAHALIYPSRYEGFGLPILEAMTCGCPVITCRNSALSEVAGNAVLFTSEDDPKELAGKIIALEAPELRGSLKKAGFEQARCFDFSLMAAIMETALLDTGEKCRLSPFLRFWNMALARATNMPRHSKKASRMKVLERY